jgi:hypothetical protein
MSIYKYGSTTDINVRSERESYQVQSDGLITAVISYNYAPAGTGSPEPLEEVTWGEAHPDYSTLKLTGANITRVKANIFNIEKTYQGCVQTDEAPNIFGIVTTEIKTDTSTDPIDTHKNFYDNDDGTDGFGTTSGTFEDDDTTKRFLYFPNDADDHLGGVRSYLAPQMTVNAVLVKNLDSGDGWDTDFIYNIGLRVDDGDALLDWMEVPSITPRDWLITRMSQTRHGGALKIQITLRMSGSEGWNEKLYNEAT